MGAVVGDRPLARPDVAQDPDVLAHPRQRLGERLAVPALDDLRSGDAETEDHPPAAEVVERHRRHRGRGRRPRRDLHDRRAELDLLGRRAPPGERHQRVGAVRLGGPDRVKAEPLGLDAPPRPRPAAGRRPSSRAFSPSRKLARHRAHPIRRSPVRRCSARGPTSSAGAAGCAATRRGSAAGRPCGPRARTPSGRGGGRSERALRGTSSMCSLAPADACRTAGSGTSRACGSAPAGSTTIAAAAAWPSSQSMTATLDAGPLWH